MRKKKLLGKQKIIEAAIVEFKDKGYDSASMRDISSRAGMTVGNIYCYYKGKEALFASLVTEPLSELKRFVDDANTIIIRKKSGDSPELDNRLREFTKYIKENRERIIILIEGSRGTKFANSRKELADKLAKSVNELIEVVTQNGKNGLEDNKKFVMQLMANSYMDGFVQILKNFKSERWAEEALKDLIQLNLYGLFSFFK